MATVVAQIRATMKGRTIQKLVEIRAPSASTFSMMRARSTDRFGGIFGLSSRSWIEAAIFKRPS